MLSHLSEDLLEGRKVMNFIMGDFQDIDKL